LCFGEAPSQPPQKGRGKGAPSRGEDLIRVFPQEIADQVRDEGINPAMRDLPK